MSYFLFSYLDSNEIESFSVLRDLIKDDTFDYFMEAYSDIIKNFDNYILSVDHYNSLGNYIKIKLHESTWFDCYLIFWAVGAQSLIHDHAENGCLYKVLSGSLKEERFSNISLRHIDSVYMKEGDINEITNDLGYHRMTNTENEVSVSIHFYSPANYEMNVFN
jgi:predicted metal-dependent enzyme (double-stranded beta helix superfamily)